MSSNEQPCPDTYWLPGAMLAAGPYPGFDVETIRLLLDAGIRAFIDLTQQGELDSYEAFLEEEAAERDIDVAYFRFAIRDGHAPDQSLMEQILSAVAHAHAEQRAVYVHCWGGIRRTEAFPVYLRLKYRSTASFPTFTPASLPASAENR